MIKHLPFDEHAAEYDAWFEKHPMVFESELVAIRQAWPPGNHLVSLEIGSATGRFAKALDITEGIEPATNMCDIAESRGVRVFCGTAEHLPYGDLQFDVVLMNCCISYFENIDRAFAQAFRVLRYGGCLLVAFIDRQSLLGNYYEKRRPDSVFYKEATFFLVKDIETKIRNAGFSHLSFTQTLFADLDKITKVEPVRPGYGEGSYVIIKALKDVHGQISNDK